MATVWTQLGKFLGGFSPLFYLKTPSGSSFKELHEVPNYLREVTPHFFLLIVIEVIVRLLQSKKLPRINDSINSISHGIMMELARVLTGTFEFALYVWIYNNLRIADLPWNSPFVWWVAFFGVDLGYYWFHRMAHEVNIFWMAHQVHHSSEDYTLSTALRQSLLQRLTSWVFYLPLALVVSPPAYIVHKQLNLLYQFWIHTEVISNLGPLEWILNTPSHHRVHHGRNPYCIDKNYGKFVALQVTTGVLIIWDRIFGTFAPEGDKVIYGLVHPLDTWNPLWGQFHHLIYIIRNIGVMRGIKNKLLFLVNGPGWFPGKPRLGDAKDIPEVSPDVKPYDCTVPSWLTIYCLLHFLLTIYLTHTLGKVSSVLPYFTSLGLILFFFYALTNFGLMFDRKNGIDILELIRIVVFFFGDFIISYQNINLGLSWNYIMMLRIVYVFSFFLWVIIFFRRSMLY